MAFHHSADGITYNPLPLAPDDHAGDMLYSTAIPPSSPDPERTSFSTPRMQTNALPNTLAGEESLLPTGATQPRFLGQALYAEGQRESYASSDGPGESTNNSVRALNDQNVRSSSYSPYRDDPSDRASSSSAAAAAAPPLLSEKRTAYADPRSQSKRRMFWMLGAAVGLVIIAVAVIIPVYFTVIKPKNSSKSSNNAVSSSSSGGSSGSSPSSATPGGSTNNLAVSGGDGSVITMEDGTTFTYNNSFGGMWYWDPNDPFNNNAQAQSWSPALNATFNYGTDKIRGVNLGGWLNTEPFIVPALYQKYANTTPQAVDEWTLSQAMTADTSSDGGLQQLETHYQTFITEQDFAQIAGAGLNFVRIPIGWWAIETREGEPFLAQTSWTYFLKAVQWARKYGLRVNLDLHAIPGSQNGWNHSGRSGTINFLNGPMGVANAQRALDYIRILAEFISQPEYSNVVPVFGILNEPRGDEFGHDQLASFYVQAYNVVREASGLGQGNGPFVAIHDGFTSLTEWVGFLPNADRLALDTHPYICFNGQSDAPMSSYSQTGCKTWGSTFNTSLSDFGLTTAGEFSVAVTDCGLFLNGVGMGTRYEGTFPGTTGQGVGTCDTWTDYQNFDDTTKQGMMNFALGSMDALQNYFYWTWKIGPALDTGVIEAPQWSYQLGLQEGWLPTDPRTATGYCGDPNPFDGPLQSWQTGGADAGSIPATATNTIAWPPPTISSAGAASTLQTYTPTSALITLPGPTFASTSGISVQVTASPNVGSGWQNPSDTASMMVMPSGCSYVDPWIGPTATLVACPPPGGAVAAAAAVATTAPTAAATSY